MIVNYRRVRCDECDKEVEIKEEYGGYPCGWLELTITEWHDDYGSGRLNKEVCSEECALKLLKELKEIPTQETKNIF